MSISDSALVDGQIERSCFLNKRDDKLNIEF